MDEISKAKSEIVRLQEQNRTLYENFENNAIWHRTMEKDLRKLQDKYDEIKERVIENEQILVRIDHLTSSLSDVNSNVEKLSCKLEDISSKKGEEYDKIRLSIITGTIMLIVGAISGAIFSLIMK